MNAVANVVDWSDHPKQPIGQKPSQGFYFVTPEMASLWVSTMNYEHQRELRAYHVNSLAGEMEAGRFRQKTQINFCELDGEYFMTNGQHTCSAIVKSGLPQLLCVVVTSVKSKKEIADDFARHDTHLTRRMSDSLAAHEVHLHFGITPTQLNAVTAACIYFATGVGQIPYRTTNITHDAKLDLVMKHGDRAVQCVKFLEGHFDKSFLTRKTTLASMMFTLPHHAGVEFWEGIRDDDGLRVGDPRKVVLEFLKSAMTVGSRTGVRNIHGKITPSHMLVKSIAVGWNAWVGRRELRLIRASSSATEAVFDGVGAFRC